MYMSVYSVNFYKVRPLAEYPLHQSAVTNSDTCYCL